MNTVLYPYSVTASEILYMNRIIIYLLSFITSKRIKLESPGWSGLVENSKTANQFFAETSIAKTACVCTHITSKQIELESPGCSGFEANLKGLKHDQQRTSSSIRLEVMYV